MLPPLSKLTLDTEETSGQKRTINDVRAGENSDVPAPQRRLNSVHDEHEYRVGIIPFGDNDPRTIDNESGEPHGLLTRKDIATIVRDREKMKRFCNSEFMIKHLPEKMRLRNSKTREDKTASTIVFAMQDKDLIGLVVIDNYLPMAFYSQNDTSMFSSPGVDDAGWLKFSERKDYSYAWLQNNADIDATSMSSNILDILAKHKVVLRVPYLAYGCTVRSVEGDVCRTGVMRYLLAAFGYWHNNVIVKNKVEAMTRAAVHDYNAAKRKFDLANMSLALELEQDEIVADLEAMESAKTAYDNLMAVAEVGSVEAEMSPAFVQIKAAKQTYDVANETYTRKHSLLQNVKSVYERAKVDFDSASATLESLKDREALEHAVRRLSFFKLTHLDDNAFAAWRALGFEYREVFDGKYTRNYLVRNMYHKDVEEGVARPVASEFIGRCRKAAAPP